MNAFDRLVALLHRAQLDGGWTDEAVAADVLLTLGLDNDGEKLEPVERPWVGSDTA